MSSKAGERGGPDSCRHEKASSVSSTGQAEKIVSPLIRTSAFRSVSMVGGLNSICGDAVAFLRTANRFATLAIPRKSTTLISKMYSLGNTAIWLVPGGR